MRWRVISIKPSSLTANAFVAGTGYGSNNATTTDVPVTINQHFGVPVTFNVNELGGTNRDLFAEQAEGMPFRNLNDGVTPVVIGANDWASAWAVDDNGMWMYPVGRGFAGERQREMAYRFGVNLIMHVLTGNYKSDQVHVPALLERLGQ